MTCRQQFVLALEVYCTKTTFLGLLVDSGLSEIEMGTSCIAETADIFSLLHRYQQLGILPADRASFMH